MTDKLLDKSGIQNVAPSKNIAWSVVLFLFHKFEVFNVQHTFYLAEVYFKAQQTLDSKNVVWRMKETFGTKNGNVVM